MAENKFPSEVIDLPIEGKLYPEDSPLRDGKLEIKYMTAREEDILTSQNLIKKGLVIEKLLDSLILTEGVKSGDLVIGITKNYGICGAFLNDVRLIELLLKSICLAQDRKMRSFLFQKNTGLSSKF